MLRYVMLNVNYNNCWSSVMLELDDGICCSPTSPTTSNAAQNGIFRCLQPPSCNDLHQIFGFVVRLCVLGKHSSGLGMHPVQISRSPKCVQHLAELLLLSPSWDGHRNDQLAQACFCTQHLWMQLPQLDTTKGAFGEHLRWWTIASSLPTTRETSAKLRARP